MIEILTQARKRNEKTTVIDVSNIDRAERLSAFGGDLHTLKALEAIRTFSLGNPASEYQENPAISKNPLSSYLIHDLVTIFFCIEMIHSSSGRVVVKGLSATEEYVLLRYFSRPPLVNAIRHFYRQGLLKIASLVRALAIISYSQVYWLCKDVSGKQEIDIGLLTYADGSARTTRDPYYGNLLDRIKAGDRTKIAKYLVLIYFPYSPFASSLEGDVRDHIVVNKFCKVSDYLSIAARCVRLTFGKCRKTQFTHRGKCLDLTPLFVQEIQNSVGTNFPYICMAKTAMHRLVAACGLKRLIYPFENKPIEKAVLGTMPSEVVTVGYQHSSITRNHFALRVTPEELAVNPLPGKIVTLGRTTYEWLLLNSSIPKEKLVCGYALRQDHLAKISSRRYPIEGAVRLLFAFSSSLSELKRGVAIIQDLLERDDGFDICIRTHPNFPLTSLPKAQANWAQKRLIYRPHQTLVDALEWADVTIYMSSTVGLDSLRQGVPVIRINEDAMMADPLLEDEVPNRWVVANCEELIRRAKSIVQEAEGEYSERQRAGCDFASQYMLPEKPDAYRCFLN